jgi:protein-S-isoprenylcysteine O-methyltransferase Ste14
VTLRMTDFISELLRSTPDGPIFLALAVVWGVLAAYWAGAFINGIATGRQKPERTSGGSLAHELTPRLVIALVVVGVVVPGSRGVLVARLVPGPNVLSLAGVGIAALGSAFAIWARHGLGGNWGARIGLKQGHTLVRTGPYAIVRHPIYTAVGVGMAGSAIALANAAGILVLLGVLLFLFFRMGDEETMPEGEFGDEYLEYEKTVKRFVPFWY